MSDSNSSNTQQTHQTDNRRVIGQGGISAENSSVTIRNRTTTLDGQVANAAMTGMRQTAAAAIQSGNENLLASLGFGKSAIAAALSAQADALAFAQANGKQAMAISSAAMDQTANAFSQALSFADKQNVRSFDSLASTGKLVADAYADAKGRGALTDKILIGAIAAMALVSFAAVQK